VYAVEALWRRGFVLMKHAPSPTTDNTVSLVGLDTQRKILTPMRMFQTSLPSMLVAVEALWKRTTRSTDDKEYVVILRYEVVVHATAPSAEEAQDQAKSDEEYLGMLLAKAEPEVVSCEEQ
jgi:hypothetical protein